MICSLSLTLCPVDITSCVSNSSGLFFGFYQPVTVLAIIPVEEVVTCQKKVTEVENLG